MHANALFVPAALLEPPFYRPAAAGSGPAATPGPGPRDYGALGGLMGHEVRLSSVARSCPRRRVAPPARRIAPPACLGHAVCGARGGRAAQIRTCAGFRAVLAAEASCFSLQIFTDPLGATNM